MENYWWDTEIVHYYPGVRQRIFWARHTRHHNNGRLYQQIIYQPRRIYWDTELSATSFGALHESFMFENWKKKRLSTYLTTLRHESTQNAFRLQHLIAYQHCLLLRFLLWDSAGMQVLRVLSFWCCANFIRGQTLQFSKQSFGIVKVVN